MRWRRDRTACVLERARTKGSSGEKTVLFFFSAVLGTAIDRVLSAGGGQKKFKKNETKKGSPIRGTFTGKRVYSNHQAFGRVNNNDDDDYLQQSTRKTILRH